MFVFTKYSLFSSLPTTGFCCFSKKAQKKDKYFENTSNILSYPTPGNSAASAGWDATLHSKAIYVSNFSSGYNGGVTNPTQGFHAHWQLIDNIPTIVFPNLNS